MQNTITVRRIGRKLIALAIELVVLVVLVTAVGYLAMAANAEPANMVQGTWMETLTATDNSFPPFQTLITYDSDGGLIGTASIDSTPATMSSPTHGAWARTSDGKYSWTGRAFSFDEHGTPNGTYIINETIAVNATGNGYSGSGTFKIVNNGAVVFSGAYTLTAERVAP